VLWDDEPGRVLMAEAGRILVEEEEAGASAASEVAASVVVVPAEAGRKTGFLYSNKVTQRDTEKTQSYTVRSSVDLCDTSVELCVIVLRSLNYISISTGDILPPFVDKLTCHPEARNRTRVFYRKPDGRKTEIWHAVPAVEGF
jgi:hypothetical protein